MYFAMEEGTGLSAGAFCGPQVARNSLQLFLLCSLPSALYRMLVLLMSYFLL